MLLTKQEAKDLGMTHEGTLYGVEVYLHLTEGDLFFAEPKFVPNLVWIAFCDFMYGAASFFMPCDKYLITPMTVGDPI